MNSYQDQMFPHVPVDTKPGPWKEHKGCPGGSDQQPAVPVSFP